VGKRSNTYGMAIADMVNETWKKKGTRLKDLLPAWVPNIATAPYRDISFSSRMNWATVNKSRNPAPQKLGED